MSVKSSCTEDGSAGGNLATSDLSVPADVKADHFHIRVHQVTGYAKNQLKNSKK